MSVYKKVVQCTWPRHEDKYLKEFINNQRSVTDTFAFGVLNTLFTDAYIDIINNHYGHVFFKDLKNGPLKNLILACLEPTEFKLEDCV